MAQFHGRWPYLRVLGVEQPVAALASLIHLASALLTLHRLLSPLPSHTSSLLVAWSAHLVGVCVASLASLALHTLASPATEACHRASLLLPGITSLGLLGARANGGTTRLLLLVLLLCFCLATPLLALHLGEELTQVHPPALPPAGAGGGDLLRGVPVDHMAGLSPAPGLPHKVRAITRSPPSPGQPLTRGELYRITHLEEGVAQARGPTVCEAPLYAVPLPP